MRTRSNVGLRDGLAGLRVGGYTEVVVAAAALTLLAVVVFGAQVREGGFYSDDWSTASAVEFRGYLGTVGFTLHHVIPGRPVLAASQPVTHYLFGLDTATHLAVGVLLAAVTSLSFFVFLRCLRVEFPHALAMAALSLVFPWSIGLRLWAIGAIDNLALIAYFLGTASALTALGLRQDRRGKALTLHVVATVLYVASVLTYQIAPAVMLASVVLYRTRVSWRRASRRWAIDATVVLVATAASGIAMSRMRRIGAPSDVFPDIPRFVRDGLAIFAQMFLPPDFGSALPKVVVLGVAAVVVTLAIVRPRDGSRAIRTWLVRGAAGAAAIALSYVMFLGSGLLASYSGIDDRANALAAFGFVVAAYSLLVLVSLLVPRGRSGWSAACLAVSVLLLGSGWIARVRDDITLFRVANARQAEELSLLDEVVGRPRSGSTLLVFGFPATTAPGIPIFSQAWDLEGAMRLRWNDYSLGALPIFRRGITCTPRGIRALEFDQGQYTVPYERAVFVDLATRDSRRVQSREACLRALPEFTPGPLVEP
jgi:hypothetical protein